MTISTTAKEAAERILRRVNDPRGNALYLHEAAEIVQAAIDAETAKLKLYTADKGTATVPEGK